MDSMLLGITSEEVSMDAITLLKDDHNDLKSLLKKGDERTDDESSEMADIGHDYPEFAQQEAT